MTAGVLNGIVLLAPVIFIHGRLPDAVEIWSVACVCLAVAAEAMCVVTPATPEHDDLNVLNWAQGLGLLTAFELSLVSAPQGHMALGLCLAGGVMVLAGACLRCLAIRQLGEGFTNTSRPATTVLCRDGIYRWLRHPAETGLLLIAAGFPLALGAWQAMLVVMPVLALLSLIRIRCEERGLAKAFPDAYGRPRGVFRRHSE